LIIKLDSIIKLIKICFWCFEKGTLEFIQECLLILKTVSFFYFEQYDSVFFEPFSCWLAQSFLPNPGKKG